MSPKAATWNYRPAGRSGGDYGLEYELRPIFRDPEQRAALRDAILRGPDHNPRPHDGLADIVAAVAEDALAARLRAEISPARLRRAGYYCTAKVFTDAKQSGPDCLVLWVESGSPARPRIKGREAIPVPRDEDLLARVARATDRPETAAAIAAALTPVLASMVIGRGSVAIGLTWKVQFMGHAGGDGPDDGYWWQDGAA